MTILCNFNFIFILNSCRLNFIEIKLIKNEVFMLHLDMIYELILSIISILAMISEITKIRLFLSMSSPMIISISYCSERFITIVTLVWLFSCMNSLMNLKISAFVENFFADFFRISLCVIAYMLTSKYSFYFL